MCGCHLSNVNGDCWVVAMLVQVYTRTHTHLHTHTHTHTHRGYSVCLGTSSPACHRSVEACITAPAPCKHQPIPQSTHLPLHTPPNPTLHTPPRTQSLMRSVVRATTPMLLHRHYSSCCGLGHQLSPYTHTHTHTHEHL